MKLDELESAFRAAAKVRFHRDEVAIRKTLVVTDLDREARNAYRERVRGFLTRHYDLDPTVVGFEDYGSVEGLVRLVDTEKPDLVITYRNLNTDGWKYAHSLGVYLEVLTQATPVPVLVTPSPHATGAAERALVDTSRVMVVTDHLTGDDRLVSHGLAFTADGGSLFLAHVENQRRFDRFMRIIEKIPAIDTELARQRIAERLLSEPADYVESVRKALESDKTAPRVEPVVCFGHEVSMYGRLVDEHAIDLLVMNSKDDTQLAMSGDAYSIAIELRRIPLLLL